MASLDSGDEDESRSQEGESRVGMNSKSLFTPREDDSTANGRPVDKRQMKNARRIWRCERS